MLFSRYFSSINRYAYPAKNATTPSEKKNAEWINSTRQSSRNNSRLSSGLSQSKTGRFCRSLLPWPFFRDPFSDQARDNRRSMPEVRRTMKYAGLFRALRHRLATMRALAPLRVTIASPYTHTRGAEIPSPRRPMNYSRKISALFVQRALRLLPTHFSYRALRFF